MKIGGASGPNGAAPAGSRRAAAAGGFASLAQASATTAAAPASAAGASAAVAGVEALLALQDVGGPLERRRRMISRGRRLLDDLDSLKLTLLDGGDSGAALARLRRGAAEAREQAQDTGLDEVLDQIDLRAAVELAKAETASIA